MNRMLALFVGGPMDGCRRLIESDDDSYVSYTKKVGERHISAVTYVKRDLCKTGHCVWAPEEISDADLIAALMHRYVKEGQTPNEARLEEQVTSIAQHLQRVLTHATGIDVAIKRRGEDYVQAVMKQHDHKLEQ